MIDTVFCGVFSHTTGPALAKDGTQKTEKQKDGKIRLDGKDEDGKVSKKNG